MREYLTKSLREIAIFIVVLLKGLIVANLVFISIYFVEYTFLELSILMEKYLHIQIQLGDAWTSYLRLAQNISPLALFTISVVKDFVRMLRTTAY